jgi:hypothetical protein
VIAATKIHFARGLPKIRVRRRVSVVNMDKVQLHLPTFSGAAQLINKLGGEEFDEADEQLFEVSPAIELLSRPMNAEYRKLNSQAKDRLEFLLIFPSLNL